MTTLIAAFRHLSRRHGQAVRRMENLRATAGEDARTDALAAVQEVEREAESCLLLVRTPESMGR